MVFESEKGVQSLAGCLNIVVRIAVYEVEAHDINAERFYKPTGMEIALFR